MVLLVEYYDGQVGFWGTAANIVETNPKSPLYVGALHSTVGCAQLSARLWLFAFMAHHGSTVARDKDLVVRYDSESAAKMSQAQWLPNTNLTPSRIAAGMRQVIDQFMRVSFEHIKSHSGDPWNEYADHMCDCGGTFMVASFPSAGRIFLDCPSSPLQAGWGFLLVADDYILAAYPWLDRQAGRLDARKVVPSLEPSIDAATIAKDVDCGTAAPDDTCPLERVWIGAATHNAQTLAHRGKRDLLAAQFRRRKISIVGVQETRDKHDSDRSIDGWLFIGGAAIDGDYGAAIWIDTQPTIGSRGSQKFKRNRSSVTIMLRSARLTIIVIFSDVCSIVVVSGHIPLDDSEWWWSLLHQTLDQNNIKDLPVVWLVDGNGRVQANAHPNVAGPVTDGQFELPVNSTANNNIARGMRLVETLPNDRCGCQLPLARMPHQ